MNWVNEVTGEVGETAGEEVQCPRGYLDNEVERMTMLYRLDRSYWERPEGF